MDKKTKIVATIGPATEKEPVFSQLIENGLNVVRLNFSHGDFAEHQPRVDLARKLSKKYARSIAILQDLSGPKIRIGDFGTPTGRITLVPGEIFTITTEKVVGDEKRVHVNYPTLPHELKKGNMVLIDDGKKRLEVIDIKGTEIKCKVIIGGDTKGRRGVNLPGAYLKTSSITPKDRKDLEFGIKNKVDFIALSFVRRADDIKELRDLLKKGKSEARIVAKIETQEAIENIEAIIAATDAIMIARGDLAIEIPAEQVPLLQKRIIKRCNELGKPVITATQMLESMIKGPVPTRAEVSDVANAIIDGTDAVMLSEETTLGDYPVEAVKVMTRVAKQIEETLATKDISDITHESPRTVDAVSGAVVHTAEEVRAKIIVAMTKNGTTARLVSRFRPTHPIIAATFEEKTYNQLALTWGITPLLVDRSSSINSTWKEVRSYLLKEKLVKKGDRVVVTAGMPFGTRIATNMLVVETV